MKGAEIVSTLLATACLTMSAPDRALAEQPAPASSALTEASLTLLGTGGGPGGRVERAGIATLLQVGSENYLIDAGDGVSRQLAFTGVREPAISRVFLTHLHDDHTVGLLALSSFAFTMRGPQMEIIGPVGTQDLVTALISVLRSNAEIRMTEGRFAAGPEVFLRAREFRAGVVYQDANVRVTAAENTHFRLPQDAPAARNKSYALRFETPGKVIVFSGDTGPSPELEQFARGADMLVAEMASATDRRSVPPAVLVHMDQEHLSPTEVGRLAQRAGVGTLVLAHVGVVDRNDLAEVRRNFSGRTILGRDLMRLTP